MFSVVWSCNIVFYSQYLLEGFDSHLTDLKANPPNRAVYDVRSLTGEACFALPGKPKPEENSRRKQFGFSRRYQRSTSTDTHSTYSTARQGRSTTTSRQSPGPQTEKNVQWSYSVLCLKVDYIWDFMSFGPQRVYCSTLYLPTFHSFYSVIGLVIFLNWFLVPKYSISLFRPWKYTNTF